MGCGHISCIQTNYDVRIRFRKRNFDSKIMPKRYIALFFALVLTSGCASKKIISDESGDGSAFFYMGGVASKAEFIERESKRLKSNLSPNFYDYDSQYYSRFLNIVESSREAPSAKPSSGLSKARNVADAVMATDLLGSALLGGPSLFGRGFNISMLGLSAIAPQSPEEAFVSSVKLSLREFDSRSLTLMKVDKIDESYSDKETESLFQKRLAEIRAAARKSGMSCDSRPEHVGAGLYRSSSMIGAECDFKGLKIKVSRKSELTMPGSIVREISGPSVVSRVVFYNLNEDTRKAILDSHASLTQQGWVAIYPEKSGGLAKNIVVQSEKEAKRFEAPKPIEG